MYHVLILLFCVFCCCLCIVNNNKRRKLESKSIFDFKIRSGSDEKTVSLFKTTKRIRIGKMYVTKSTNKIL